MKNRIFSLLFSILASLLSGVLMVLAFPTHDVGWLAWVALVPLLLAISGKRPIYGFLLSFLYSMVFFPGIGNWLFQVHGYRFLHHALIGLYLGPLTGLFGLAFSHISRRRGTTKALFSAPFIWVTLEYIRSNLFFLAVPFGLLGYSQQPYPQVIQIASVTGTYGISFLIVMVNSALAAIVLFLLNRSKRITLLSHASISKRALIGSVSTAAVLTILTLFYGQVTLSRSTSGNGIKVSVIQGNIKQSHKWDPKYAKSIMQTYIDLSKAASEERPALIVWPEAATPGFVLVKGSLLRQMRAMIKLIKTHFLIGSSEYPKSERGSLKLKKRGNTALFFSPQGRLLGQHLKIRLVPFVEYIPYREIVPWPKFMVPHRDMNPTTPGKKFTLFDLDGVKFGVLICWESLFPGLFRKFVKDGADFIINISNEAWFGETDFAYQFLAVNALRAVENRVPVVRAGNTGISCFIDPYGKITSRLRDINNKDVFVRGHLTQEVRFSQEKTFYTAYGDIIAYISIVMSLLMTAFSFSRNNR